MKFLAVLCLAIIAGGCAKPPAAPDPPKIQKTNDTQTANCDGVIACFDATIEGFSERRTRIKSICIAIRLSSCQMEILWPKPFKEKTEAAWCGGQGPTGNPVVQILQRNRKGVLISLMSTSDTDTVATYEEISCVGWEQVKPIVTSEEPKPTSKHFPKKHKTAGELAWENFEQTYNDKNGLWGPCEYVAGVLGFECQIEKGTKLMHIRRKQ